MTHEEVTQIVLQERDMFLQRNSSKYKDYDDNLKYEAINHGDCYILADIVYRRIIKSLSPKEPIIHLIRKIDTQMFTVNEGFLTKGTLVSDYDIPKLEIDIETFLMPPELYNIVTYQELIDMHMCLGTHCFVMFDGMLYDSECPYGVKHVFDIPFFRRSLDIYIGKKYREPGRLQVLLANTRGTNDRFFLNDREISPKEADSYRGTYVDICTCDNDWKIISKREGILGVVNGYSDYARHGGYEPHVFANCITSPSTIELYLNNKFSEYDFSNAKAMEREKSDRLELVDADIPGIGNCEFAIVFASFGFSECFPSFSISFCGVALCEISLLDPYYINWANGFVGFNNDQKMWLNTFLASPSPHYLEGATMWEGFSNRWNICFDCPEEYDDDKEIILVDFEQYTKPDYRLLDWARL